MLSKVKVFGALVVAGVVALSASSSARADLLVLKVVPNSAADQAGLSVGDVIIEANGAKMASQSDLLTAINDSNGDLPMLVKFKTGGRDILEATITTGTLGVQVKPVQTPPVVLLKKVDPQDPEQLQDQPIKKKKHKKGKNF